MRRGFLNNQKVKAAPLYPEKVHGVPKGLQGEGLSFLFFLNTSKHVYHRCYSKEHYRTDSDGQKFLKLPYGSSGKAGEWQNP